MSSFLFFVSFMFVVSLVFLKLFIAIILDGYSKTQEQDTRLFNNDVKEHFREVWADFDPYVSIFNSIVFNKLLNRQLPS